MKTRFSAVPAALLAGAVAVLGNELLLAAAGLVPLATADGGLLRLAVVSSGGRLHPPSSYAFGVLFHVLIALLMALAYAWLLEPHLPGSAWRKGWQYALAVWLLNAFVVLPAIGKGVAGHLSINVAGMLWFALAHAAFFLVLAWMYQRLYRGGTARDRTPQGGGAAGIRR